MCLCARARARACVEDYGWGRATSADLGRVGLKHGKMKPFFIRPFACYDAGQGHDDMVPAAHRLTAERLDEEARQLEMHCVPRPSPPAYFELRREVERFVEGVAGIDTVLSLSQVCGGFQCVTPTARPSQSDSPAAVLRDARPNPSGPLHRPWRAPERKMVH